VRSEPTTTNTSAFLTLLLPFMSSSSSFASLLGANDANKANEAVTVLPRGMSPPILSTPATAAAKSSDDSDDDDEVMVMEGPHASLKRAGRVMSMVWELFTDATRPSQLKSAMCKHCNTLINHHKKSEYAKAHLNKCLHFRKYMNGFDYTERPEWFSSKKRATADPGGCDMLATMCPPSTSRQSSIWAYGLPKVAVKNKQQFQEHMAMHFYATGTSFQRIDDVHLKEAIKVLRPDDGMLPNRKQLATTLLDKCHQKLMAKVDARLKCATACLTTDGWSNIKNDPVVNYMAVSPECSLFLESVSTGQQGHDHKFLAADIARVIRKHEGTSFAGAVTDNTSTNKKAWKLLEEMFPSSYFQGCCSHGIHLLVKDIFAATKTKRNGAIEATYPTGYPFEDMLMFTAGCRDIVKFFHNHHIVKAQLLELQKTTNAKALIRPAPTRWGTIQGMCSTLLDSESHLHAMVSAREFIKGTATQKAERMQLKDIITDNQFVTKLKKALAILVPLDRLIVKYQSDKVPISAVLPDFYALPKEFEKIYDAGSITQGEFDYLGMLSRERLKFMYGKAHGLSYILDPCHLGEGLSADLRLTLETALFETPVDDIVPTCLERQELLCVQYTEFVIASTKQKEMNTFHYKMLAKGSKSVLQYWLVDGKAWPELQKVATKLFSMATSSAASERNFSTMGFLHSKLRNRLTINTVEKLVFIKSNLSAFYDQAWDAEDSESFSENEAEMEHDAVDAGANLEL
jgi:Protein of unknown function (DUF 659)/hAT family C-terminal dimerisation region